MKALTLTRPKRYAMAYLCGVYFGDGWCSQSTFGLAVNDRDFAEAFAIAVNHAFDCSARARPDGTRWRVAIRNDSGRFSLIPNFITAGPIERALWVRGLFDSEGNANIHKSAAGPESWIRRVSFYNTEQDTLERCANYLAELGISAIIRPMKASQGHRGLKQVYELSLKGRQKNYVLFASLVGSNIERKMRTVREIALSYQEDLAAHCRRAQAIGVANRLRYTDEVRVPAALSAISNLIKSGVKPTQRNCYSVPGYFTLARRMSQSEIVRLAMAGGTE
jgi:hypothetical protein